MYCKLAKFQKINLARSKKTILSKDFMKINLSKTDFLTSKTKKVFTHLWKTFSKALIPCYFDPELYICIETDLLGYVIGDVLSQMTLDQHFSNPMPYEDPISTRSDISLWHLVTFFSLKIISAKIRYETYNQDLMAIVEVFQTWHHYLEGYQYEVFVFTHYNNFYWFIDTKNLSSCLVC